MSTPRPDNRNRHAGETGLRAVPRLAAAVAAWIARDGSGVAWPHPSYRFFGTIHFDDPRPGRARNLHVILQFGPYHELVTLRLEWEDSDPELLAPYVAAQLNRAAGRIAVQLLRRRPANHQPHAHPYPHPRGPRGPLR